MLTYTDEILLKDFGWNDLTEREQGYLVGIFLGDGNLFCSNKSRIYRIRFFFSTKNDEEIIQKMKKILKRIFKLHKIRIFENKKNMKTIEIHSKTLVNKLLEITEKKKLKCIDWSSDFLKGVIEGLIDSDGYISWKRAQIVTANEELRDQLFQILRGFGINFKIYKSVSHWSPRIMWRIYFPYENIFFPLKLNYS